MRHGGIVDQSYMCLWNSPWALTIVGLLDIFTKFPAQTSSLTIAPTLALASTSTSDNNHTSQQAEDWELWEEGENCKLHYLG